MSGRSRTLLLSAIVAALLAVRVARVAPERYSTDALYLIAAADNARTAPAGVLSPDFTGRRHVLFFGALTLVQAVFGPSLLPLLVLTYLGHLAASLLLSRLVEAVGAPPHAATLAGILFAVFPGANNLFADPIHFARTWNLALAVAALLAVVVGRRWLYVLLYALTLANYEDAALLPVAAVAADLLVARPPRDRRWLAPHAAALALLATFAALALADPTPAAGVLRLGPHVARNLARLPLEIAHSALLLRSDVLGSFAARAAIATIAAAATLATLRPRDLALRPFLLLALTALLFAAPYSLRPGDGAWQSRYLYFPAAGLVAAAAVALATAARRPVIVLAVYAGIVGAINTEAACDVITSRHMHRFATAPHAVIGAVARSLAGRSGEPLRLPAADCEFLARVHTPRPVPCVGGGPPMTAP